MISFSECDQGFTIQNFQKNYDISKDIFQKIYFKRYISKDILQKPQISLFMPGYLKEQIKHD